MITEKVKSFRKYKRVGFRTKIEELSVSRSKDYASIVTRKR